MAHNEERDHQLDHQLRDGLKAGTEESVQQQDKIWSAIKGQIQEERRHKDAAGSSILLGGNRNRSGSDGLSRSWRLLPSLLS